MSLFESLDHPVQEAYPATALSKALIDLIARDISAFRYNARVAFLIVDFYSVRRSRIDQLIHTVETSTEEEVVINAYQRYSTAIDPLEQALLSLAVEIDMLRKENPKRISVTSMDLAVHVKAIETWMTQRRVLRELSTAEQSKTVDLYEQQDLRVAYQTDDIRVLEELVKEAEEHLQHASSATMFNDLDESQYVCSMSIDRLRNIFAVIESKYTDFSDGIIVLIIRFIMSICWALRQILLKTTVIQKLSSFPDASARVQDVSRSIAKYTSDLRTLVNTDSKTTRETLARGLEESIATFFGVVRNHWNIKQSVSFIELMRVSGRVGRPYHSQALYLVELCSELSRYAGRSGQDTKPFENAVNSALQALNAARQTSGGLRRVELGVYDTHETTVLFTKAASDIRVCYEQYGLQSAWTDRQESLRKSMVHDKERIVQVNERLEAFAAAKSDRLQVHIRIRRTLNEQVVNLTYYAWPQTRLHALQWKVSQEDVFKSVQVLSKGTYFTRPNQPNAKLWLDTDIESLIEAGSTRCDLHMFIP